MGEKILKQKSSKKLYIMSGCVTKTDTSFSGLSVLIIRQSFSNFFISEIIYTLKNYEGLQRAFEDLSINIYHI